MPEEISKTPTLWLRKELVSLASDGFRKNTAQLTPSKLPEGGQFPNGPRNGSQYRRFGMSTL